MDWQPVATAPFGRTVEIKGENWEGVGRLFVEMLELDECASTGPGPTRIGRYDVTHWREAEALPAKPMPEAGPIGWAIDCSSYDIGTRN